MAVAIWTPLKIPFLQSGGTSATSSSDSGNNNSDMEEPESGLKASLSTEMEQSTGAAPSSSEDVMEVM